MPVIIIILLIFAYYIMDNEVYIVVANYSHISEPNYLFPNSSMLSVMLFKNIEQNVLINKDNTKVR